MKTRILPTAPTKEMKQVLAESSPFISLDGKMRALAEAAPDPTENTELVERVARWLAFHNGYVHEVYYTNFMTAAKDLLKVIQEVK